MKMYMKMGSKWKILAIFLSIAMNREFEIWLLQRVFMGGKLTSLFLYYVLLYEYVLILI